MIALRITLPAPLPARRPVHHEALPDFHEVWRCRAGSRNVLPIAKGLRQARGERHQLLPLAIGGELSPLSFRDQPRAKPYSSRCLVTWRLKAHKRLPLLRAALTNANTSPNKLNTTLMPHSITHGDACFAYFAPRRY
jgi:hypothetical protein